MEKPDGRGKRGKVLRVSCSCKNSCQKGTGRKRAGCPCKDNGVYCGDQCKCGTNLIECKNNDMCGVQSDFLSLKMKANDETSSTSDAESPTKQGPSSPGSLVDGDTSVITNHSRKVQYQQRSRKVPPQPLPGEVHEINNGYALIFHNIVFHCHNLRKRHGSEKDLEAIKNFCKKAGLTIDVQENVEVQQIREHCKKLTEDGNIFQRYDGFVCFILSHGNSSGVYGIHENTISVKDIVSFFEANDDLSGKPKLFFVQACRVKKIEDDSTEQQKRLCPPDSSDTLIAYSTIKGEKSFRDIHNGSWFIQTLMKQMKAHAETSHLMDIMTAVNYDIAGSDLEGYRQMPTQLSTLTKFVYFKMETVPKDEEY